MLRRLVHPKVLKVLSQNKVGGRKTQSLHPVTHTTSHTQLDENSICIYVDLHCRLQVWEQSIKISSNPNHTTHGRINLMLHSHCNIPIHLPACSHVPLHSFVYHTLFHRASGRRASVVGVRTAAESHGLDPAPIAARGVETSSHLTARSQLKGPHRPIETAP